MSSPPASPAVAELQRLGFAMEVGHIAWWEMDCATGAVRFHRRKTDLLGYEPEAFTHYRHFTALLHPADLEPAMQAMREHLSGARPEYRLEYRIQAKSGEYRWFEDIGRVSHRDEAGRPVTITGMVMDITQRRRDQEALSASQERFRQMFHGHAAVKLIIDPANGRIVDANEAAARFYGWTTAALKAMRIQQINALPPDEVQQKMVAAAAAPQARYVFQHRRADDSIRDVEVYSTRVDLEGHPLLYSIVHDISDRVRVEGALKESEQRFRMVAENAADVIWVLDVESGNFRYVSPSVFNLRGYTADEVMSGSLAESLTRESFAHAISLAPARRRQFERGEACAHVDVAQQPTKSGAIIDVEVHSRFVRNEATRRVELLGVSRDITARLATERALHAAHDRLRHAEDFARFGHWEFSLDDLVLHASEGALQVYGYQRTAIALSDIKACALPEYRPRLDQALQDLIERAVPYDQEFKIRRRSDGAIVHVHSRAEYDPRARRVFGVVQDTTARRQIEEERERLVSELQQALEHVKTLKGIVPICAGCKKIRDGRGYWEQVEAYVSKHTEAQFSHGLCPECLERLYPDA